MHVHLNKNNKDFFVEVKLDDKSSPVAKYSATFTGGSLHFNFSRLSKAYDNKESEDRESSNFEEIMSVQAQDWFKEINTIVSKDLKLGMQKLKDLLNSHIDDIISKSRKNGWKDHSIIDGRSKTKMNKVVGLDIGDETGTSKFIDVDFSDVGIENVPVPQIKKLSKLKIHNVEFPKIFNRLVEFFDICDEMHNTKYMILRKRAIESSDGNIKPYLEKILKPSKRISQDEFMTIKKWIDGIQDDGTVSIDQEGPDGKTIVIDERTLGTLK